MSALVEAVQVLEDVRALGHVELIVSGGIKKGANAAKAAALEADAVSITAVLMAMAADAPRYADEYRLVKRSALEKASAPAGRIHVRG